jgi:hypothetical protein
MSQKKNRRRTSGSQPTPDGDALLVKDLTVADARHLLKNEGGPLDPVSVAYRLTSILVVAGFTGWALWRGTATVWHLALPSVAEYLALLLVLPVVYLLPGMKELRKDAVLSVIWIVGMVVAAAVATRIRSLQAGTPWQAQIISDASLIRQWIAEAHMHWPMAAAAGGVLLELPHRIANLKRYGPPFYAVGLGCGMRLVVLLLGFFLLPVLMSGSLARAAWILWALLLASEVLAIWMHWDIQHRLRRLDRGVSK